MILFIKNPNLTKKNSGSWEWRVWGVARVSDFFSFFKRGEKGGGGGGGTRASDFFYNESKSKKKFLGGGWGWVVNLFY